MFIYLVCVWFVDKLAFKTPCLLVCDSLRVKCLFCLSHFGVIEVLYGKEVGQLILFAKIFSLCL